MRRFSEKLLATLLSVVLSLIPLQGAIADFTSTPDRQGAAAQHQMGNHHDAGQVLAPGHKAMMDCENCNMNAGCDGDNCSSGHCVSCLLALLSDFSFSIRQTTACTVMQTGSELVNHHLSSLFRPPRAWSHPSFITSHRVIA